MPIYLTDEQKDVIRGIVKDLNNEQIICLGGHAGTGKTTTTKVLTEALKRKGLNFSACAFTGKATNVLRKKGIAADTIHGIIYKPYKNEEGETIWHLTHKSDILSRGIDGFIVDEASMVSKEIHDDLASFGLPIIYVGDHGQLEPIGTKCNLMKDPRHRLEKVHRNAGEIAFFAEHLRKGNPAITFNDAKKVQIVKESLIENIHLSTVDQVICAFNKTRSKLNERVRIHKNIQNTYLTKGEKVICLKNNKQLGLFNGMQGIVTKIHKKERFDFTSDNKLFENIHFDEDQFGKETNQFVFSQTSNPFDYAYAITAHKSQGDEFGSVIAFEQRCDKWDHIRWSYTVASRAKTSLIWVYYETFLPSYLK